MLERLGIKMTKTTKIYAWILVLALFAGAYTYFSSPSRAEVTQGSDAPLFLYGADHLINEGDDVTRPFDGDAYASASGDSVSIPFVCPQNASGASSFIAPRGKERDYNAWSAAASFGFPRDSKNLKEVSMTPAANIDTINLSQAAIRTIGGQYSLGIACTKDSGVTILNAWYRYIDVTPSTGEWTALPNDDAGEPVDPTLGQGVEGLTLAAPATAAWVKNSIYYRIDPRTFSQSHDLAGVTARIAKLKAIGVGAIVLEPIFPVSQTGKPGSLGDIYAPSYTDTINPDLGTEEEFKALITAAHAAGIKVVITWVTSHVGNDSPWLTDHDDWFLRSGLKIAQPVGKPHASLLDFSVPAVRAAVMTDMLAWVKAYDIDGIASMSANGQPAEFWDEATNRVNQIRPVVFFTSTPVATGYLTHSFASATRSDVLSAFASLAKGTSANTTWNSLTKSLATANAKATNLNFVSDYNTAALGKSDATRLGTFLNSAIAFTYVAPGAPVVNAGQEVAFAKALKPYDSNNIEWPAKAPAATAFFTKLAKLRTSNPVILNGSTSTVTTSVKTVFAMKRSSSAGTVYYVANLTKKPLTAKVNFGKKGAVYDFATGKKLTIEASQTVKIPASGYLIYTTKLVK
jgi:glycosidase